MDATVEAWSQAIRSDARADQLLQDLRKVHMELKERGQQAALMRHVANVLTATTRSDQLGSLILDVFQSEFGARQGLLWVLGEERYTACFGMGFSRLQLGKLGLPAPHPFPRYPILIYQCQWLEIESLPPALKLIQARPGDGLFFVPFEHQTLLMGFAILCIPMERDISSVEQESLEVLQRLFAASLHGAWMMLDLERQKEILKGEIEALKVRAETQEMNNQAMRSGQTFRVDFLAYASAELRSQLMGILALLSHVRLDQSLTEEDRATLLLDGMLAGKHMAELLRDLSELARPDQDAAATSVRPLDLVAFLAALKPVVMAFPRRGGGILNWPDDQDLPEILADEEGLKQVMLSLCAGALRNSRDGSLDLWIVREPMSLTLRLMMEGLDLGEATPAFNSRRPQSPEELYVKGKGGTGLGLVICRQLVVGMGGAFTLEREPNGMGTLIGLDLPLA